MVVPPKQPKMIILVGKPMVVGYHHFRKPPYLSIYLSMYLRRSRTSITSPRCLTASRRWRQILWRISRVFSPSWSVQIGVITLVLTGWRPPCIVSIFVSLKCRHSNIDLNPKVFYFLLFETIRSCSSLTDVSFPMTDACNWWKNLKSW